LKKIVDGREVEVEYVVGKSEKGWVSCHLEKGTEEELGCALIVLFEHEALERVHLLSFDEWYNHEASAGPGWSHIDRGIEVIH